LALGNSRLVTTSTHSLATGTSTISVKGVSILQTGERLFGNHIDFHLQGSLRQQLMAKQEVAPSFCRWFQSRIVITWYFRLRRYHFTACKCNIIHRME
jgi:hypothetical protein